MSKATDHCPPKWKSSELYLFLMQAFPEHHTPFNRLDVNRLASDIGKSYESLYMRLRQERLNVEWAKLLCDFANDEERQVASARNYAAAILPLNGEHGALRTSQENAEAGVHKRFAKRKPLTIEADFLRFFI